VLLFEGVDFAAIEPGDEIMAMDAEDGAGGTVGGEGVFDVVDKAVDGAGGEAEGVGDFVRTVAAGGGEEVRAIGCESFAVRASL